MLINAEECLYLLRIAERCRSSNILPIFADNRLYYPINADNCRFLRKDDYQMTRKYKTLAYRVYARSKEISAHKGVGMSMAELQRQLGLEEVGYDTFRRHVRRIWENLEGAKDWTAPALPLAPVDPPRLAYAPPPPVLEPPKAAAPPPAPAVASLKKEPQKDTPKAAFSTIQVDPSKIECPTNQSIGSIKKESQKESVTSPRKRKFSSSKISQERIDLNPDNWKKILDDPEI